MDETHAEIQDVKNIVEDLSKPELKTRYFNQQSYLEVMTDPVKVAAVGYQLQHQLLNPELITLQKTSGLLGYFVSTRIFHKSVTNIKKNMMILLIKFMK